MPRTGLGMMYYNRKRCSYRTMSMLICGSHIAASNGHESGVKLRDFVAKEMTPAQIEKAEKLASECVAKKYKGC